MQQIRSFGGGSKSSIWQQIKADIINHRICTMNETECASLGAAILAGVAIGLYPDVQTAAQVNTIACSHSPRPENVPVYDALYRRYCRVLEVSKALF